MPSPISVPSARSIGSAFGDYAVGAAGGLVFMLSQNILGQGFLGSLIAPVLAGSVIKGTRGTALATVAGFFGVASLLGSMGGNSQAADSGVSQEVM